MGNSPVIYWVNWRASFVRLFVMGKLWCFHECVINCAMACNENVLVSIRSDQVSCQRGVCGLGLHPHLPGQSLWGQHRLAAAHDPESQRGVFACISTVHTYIRHCIINNASVICFWCENLLLLVSHLSTNAPKNVTVPLFTKKFYINEKLSNAKQFISLLGQIW